MAFQVEHGQFGHVSLEDLGFIVVARAPEAMGKGNWHVGVVIDARASDEQREAIRSIASGAAGGPMSLLSAFFGKFLGMVPATIQFDRRGQLWTVRASHHVKLCGAGAMSIDPNIAEPMQMDHGGHPAADRITLAYASESHVHALGLSWDDISGRNNARYAPFAWRSS